MNLQQFLLALRARFRIFSVSVLAVVLAAAAASLLLPKSYRATVSLLVDTADEQSLRDSARPLILPQERMSYVQTQVEILTSRAVAGRVVEDLKLLENAPALATLGIGARGPGPVEDRLIEQLLANLKVETSQSSVIQARYSCADPHLAATIANGFARAYVETVLELRVAPTREAAAWFDEQLKSLRANLEEAQAKLAAYQQKTVSRYVALGGSPDSLPEVTNNTLIQQLKADVLHGDAKLKELATRLGVNHPEYQRVVAENRALRARLDAEVRKVVAGMAAAARQSPAHAAELTGPGIEARTRFADAGQPLSEYGVLKLNVEAAERAYDTAMQRRVVNQIDSRASETNVAILSPAIVPWNPYRPRIALNLALALASGIMLGIALVALLETQDRRVRCTEDLLSASQLPLLAVLGEEGRPAGLLVLGPAPKALRALPKSM